MTRALLLALTFFTAMHAHADAPLAVGGDIRGGWVGSESSDRLGRRSESGALLGRVRLGVEYTASDVWKFSIRAATILDTRQAGTSVFLEPYAPEPGGPRAGQGTLDEFYADYAPMGGRWGLRTGRFQTAFRLAGVAPTSLDRHDSPDFGVTWTDGAWLRHQGSHWTQHLILQHTHRRGPTNALRQPLWFSDGDAGQVAWQGSLSLVDLVPAHAVAFVYGRVADGWLVSGDFRPNEALAELR